MSVEIERKFLVNGEAWRTEPWTLLRQGYLSRDKERTVRVRLEGHQAFLTVKGRTHGCERSEFEYEIPVEDGAALLTLCQKPIIEKRRHRIAFTDAIWEVDEFLGDLAGLVIAEIELSTSAQSFVAPPWLGEEVTNDPQYFNSNLGQTPPRR